MKRYLFGVLLVVGLIGGVGAFVTRASAAEPPLGLPAPPRSDQFAQTAGMIALGDSLFNDKRFSSTGEISCATCHAAEKAFTDSPLRVSEGIDKLT
ncbi:cytochrome-c peroxidase, partial [bacterium]|nr:cytochrome-c peroxidase [bacterium]